DGWHIYFGYGMPVGTHVFDYTSTFLPTTEHPVTVTKAAFRRLQPPPVEEGILLDPNAEVTAWFGDVVEWDGGYSGKFFVTNHTDAPVRSEERRVGKECSANSALVKFEK